MKLIYIPEENYLLFQGVPSYFLYIFCCVYLYFFVCIGFFFILVGILPVATHTRLRYQQTRLLYFLYIILSIQIKPTIVFVSIHDYCVDLGRGNNMLFSNFVD